ncbi:hypothetical protein [Patiriisocius marinus]|uniref:Uncharacterized protein n=1 Tax=Patiriisocius marinus TaxID=1397112 RepID=A0A5J4J3F3_9FLAO|nr:hypothetical protein [Patiriisocius marinus]GER60403.1 hypothetical protein ULMA_25110 [Patiriisocius marinus]
MSNTKKAPLLKKNLKNEQNIENQDYPGEPNAKTDPDVKGSKNTKDVPESNDPAGYDNKGNDKESPSGQRDNN